MAGIADINISNFLTLTIDGVEVADLKNIAGGNSNVTTVDSFQYNLQYSRKVIGSKSTDAFEITCSYVPTTASYKALDALNTTNKFVECVLSLKGGADASMGSQDRTFTGTIGSKSISTEFDTERTVVYQLIVSGPIVETEGA